MNNKTTILVVEDDMHLMEGIRDILEINGYEVLTATNGVAGLDVLRERNVPPNLIVSDIMMPRMNGYDFYQAVRGVDHWLEIPFIFLTAKGEHEDILKGKELGAEDYVVKPFDADELLVTVKARLNRTNQLKEVRKKEVTEIKHNILTILNHEFRTPLTYVVAYADMVQSDADNLSIADMRSFLRGINAGANRLRRMVENLIMLVELETGEAKQSFKWRRQLITNYEMLVHNIRTKYQDIAAEHQIELVFEVADDLPPIRADMEYINAALECLVDNAIKFTDEPGKTVTCRMYTENDHVCIAVADQGRGIPSDELQNIFDSFYQINREKFEDQGAGAGLAIVDGVLRLHGGTIQIDSKEGEGSTFILNLPLASEEEPEENENATSS